MVKETLTRKQRVAEFPQGYKITVTGRHVHITDAMKAYAQEKMTKLEHIGDHIIEVLVVMDIQKLAHNVEIVMKYGQKVIKSHATTTDMYISIDQAFDKMQERLRRYKSRIKNHHGKSYPLVEVPEKVYRPVSGEAWESMSEIDEEEVNSEIETAKLYELEASFCPHRVVKVDTQPLKLLTRNEAILQIEKSGFDAMLFRDIESNKINVIYRRQDGNYGVVGPE